MDSGDEGTRARAVTWWRTLAIVVVALAVGAVGGYLLGSADDDDGPSAASPSTTTVATTTSTVASSTTTTAPATTTTEPAPASLVSQYTDADPSHWHLSDTEPERNLQVRVYDDSEFQIVADFPVTMNGCDTRQTAVRWRSLGRPVIAGATGYRDSSNTSPVDAAQVGDPAQEGTMLLNGCEQPAFAARPGESISDIAVTVTVNRPVA